MKPFKVEITPSKIKFSGAIDEHAVFPAVSEPFPAAIVLDLGNVEGINSYGIRTWITWITPISQRTTVVLENIPQQVVVQMNMVADFLPPNSKVHSFYAPVFSEKDNRESRVLLKTDEHFEFDQETIKLKADIPKLMGGGNWVLDISDRKYFRFLKSRTH